VLGKKYNITNGEQVILWDLIQRSAQALGLPILHKHVPYSVADLLARTAEIVYSLVPGRPEPPFTRYAVGSLAIGFTLDISAARRDLGYRPRVSMQEGMEAVIRDWKEAHT
jgi:nucleoside-diphosphate-sugar epimerase